MNTKIEKSLLIEENSGGSKRTIKKKSQNGVNFDLCFITKELSSNSKILFYISKSIENKVEC